MWTFLIAVIFLILGYFLYSKVVEKVFAPDDRLTPALANPDGVDKAPLKTWKAFLIELLNIAGTGPIFGAISGALFGPIVFLWIVLGCILGGAVHDYFSGMISSRHNGDSIVAVAGKYIGKILKSVMMIFSVILLVLITAVFVVSPSSLLESLTNGKVHAVIWMSIIIMYYLVATILPIDKVIGKAYPVFGIILLLMAGSIILGIFIKQDEYPLIELIGNLRDFSLNNGSLPWWPFMFVTVACGAVSGFHATQSPMIAKCITSEKQGRQVFYGAMVAEGIIALIWAASAMAFFKVNTPDGFNNLNSMGGGNSTSVYLISKTLLGPFGSILAIVGVIICPITSGDTALRSLRLIISECIHLDQKSIKNRLVITIPLFFIVGGISIWNFLDVDNFNIIWRWFAWSNQTLAAISLCVSTSYLIKTKKNKWVSLFTAIPGVFMTDVVVCYIFIEPNIALGQFLPPIVGHIAGFITSVFTFSSYIIFLLLQKRKEKAS